jgi:FkbM family methyltransferase
MQKIYGFIRSHRRAAPLRLIAKISERYLTAWENEDFFDFAMNGERYVLNRFAQWWGDNPLEVWDVGAHHGEWAGLAKAELPTARITSFELIPATYAKLRDALGGKEWSTQVLGGLSDREGTIKACWNLKFDTTSSLAPRLGDELYDSDYLEEVECSVITGAGYASNHRVPHLLKIDTEGHEVSVLRGCGPLLQSSEAPQLIQFEYGKTYLPSGSTLRQAYGILEPNGYRIGRVYPDHVQFAPYRYELDNFRMGNFVAVKSQELAELLS